MTYLISFYIIIIYVDTQYNNNNNNNSNNNKKITTEKRFALCYFIFNIIFLNKIFKNLYINASLSILFTLVKAFCF